MLNRIRIRKFRNIADIDLQLPSGVIAICGDNAQGKSSFLEAIHVLGYLDGFRNRTDKELITYEQPSSDVTGWAGDESESDELRIVITPSKKYVKINGTNITKFEDYYGRLPVHLFVPQNLELIRGEPSERRQALDYLIVRMNPQIYTVFSEFRQSLNQRNAILKRIRDRGESKESRTLITEWEHKLINSGVKISLARNDLCIKLAESIRQLYRALALSNSLLEIKYQPNLPYKSGMNVEALSEQYASMLHERMERDIRMGFTTCGPQRDEISFILDTHPLRTYGSQGQTRSAVQAFKLACCLLESETNPLVILCLDDALAELDDNRKKNLLAVLQDYRFCGARQVFITVVAASDLVLLHDMMAKSFRIAGGKIIK